MEELLYAAPMVNNEYHIYFSENTPKIRGEIYLPSLKVFTQGGTYTLEIKVTDILTRAVKTTIKKNIPSPSRYIVFDEVWITENLVNNADYFLIFTILQNGIAVTYSSNPAKVRNITKPTLVINNQDDILTGEVRSTDRKFGVYNATFKVGDESFEVAHQGLNDTTEWTGTVLENVFYDTLPINTLFFAHKGSSIPISYTITSGENEKFSVTSSLNLNLKNPTKKLRDFSLEVTECLPGVGFILTIKNPTLNCDYYVNRFNESSHKLSYLGFLRDSGGAKYLYCPDTEAGDIYYRVYEVNQMSGEQNLCATVHKQARELDSTYLYDAHNCLNIQYNPQVSVIKKMNRFNKVETLGSQYPLLIQDGQVKYNEFSLSGIISKSMESSFDETLNIGNVLTDLSDEGIKEEREFREKVYAWLSNGKPKVFMSATEPRMIVTLTDVSLTPMNHVGRALYNFSATAIEVADYSHIELFRLGFRDNFPYKK